MNKTKITVAKVFLFYILIKMNQNIGIERFNYSSKLPEFLEKF